MAKIHINCTEAEKDRWTALAKFDDKNRVEWAREILNQAASTYPPKECLSYAKIDRLERRLNQLPLGVTTENDNG